MIARAAAGIAVIGLLVRPAGAAVIVPAGFAANPAQSEALVRKLGATGHLGRAAGDPAVRVMATVYVADRPGVALSIVELRASLADGHALAARAALDELRGASRRAALAGSGGASSIVEDGWSEQADPATQLIEGTLAWRDPSTGTTSIARLVIAAEAGELVAVTGECHAGAGADARAAAACKAALATLDPGIPPARRLALALPPAGTAPPPTTSPREHPATMTDGSRAPLPPIAIRQEPRVADRRPVYVGLGLVVLAALFWWNHRRRERFEREDSDDR